MSTSKYREGKLQEEIGRLARLCEAKDTEIVRLKNPRVASEQWQALADANEQLAKIAHHRANRAEQQLSEAQAMIAMQAELLYSAAEPSATQEKADIVMCAQWDVDALAALAATSETVAAWRAKETEPLRREVAMLIESLNAACRYVPELATVPGISKALSDTQATALAYEREVENRGVVEALEELLDEADDSNWRNAAYSRIEELRAANKGE